MLLRKPVAATIIVLAVLIFGGITLNRLSIELLPDVAQPTILVRTDYLGAPASEVEYRINEQLEGILASVRGVKEIRGITRQDQSLIFLTFDWGTDMDLVFLNVREKLDQARAFLPQQAQRPQLIYSTASDQPIATIALTLKNTEDQTLSNKLALKRWAEQVFSRRLEQEKGIAQAILVGAVVPEVQIKYRPKEVDLYGLNLAQIQQVIRDANVFSAPGELRDGWYRYSLKIQSRIERIEDLRKLPVVSLANGRVLLLEEVADIIMEEADPESFAMLNGQDVLNVLIKKDYGSNTVEVFRTLQAVLDEIRAQNNEVEITVLREDATFISNSISNLMQTLLIGGALAFLVLFIFLDDFRSPFTIGISIPVSIFLTFIAMFVFKIQLNIISLSGLTLGIGLLLDNAIVVLENISRYRAMGHGHIEAARLGTKEIGLAVTASTFTTISVFLPLIFLGGFEGAFFRDLAATLTFSLLASLLVALLIMPVFVAHITKKKKEGKKAGFFAGMLNAIINSYENLLSKLLPYSWFSIGAFVLFITGAGYLFLLVNKAAMPQDVPKEVVYEISLPGNTALRSTKRAATQLYSIIKNELPGKQVLAFGGFTDNTNLAALTREGLNKFKVSIPVNGFSEADSVHSLIEGIASAFSTWRIIEETESFGLTSSVSDAPVQFSFIGTNRNDSKNLAGALNKYMAQVFPGISFREKYPQQIETFNLVFRPDRMLELELQEAEVLRYLESYTRGAWVSDWNRQDEQVAIRLIGDREALVDPSDINLYIRDRVIPLESIARVERGFESEQMERIAQSAVLTFQTNLTFLDWWWRGDEIKSLIQQFMQQTGADVKIEGSALQLLSLLQELGLLLLISVILIYLILAIQYENLTYPFIIILAIPFAWIGSILALYFTGFSLNALSFMGILILTGIAVNDSILKVDFMRRYFEETGNLKEAIRQAGINRFRPVVMTSMTTILGLIPMLIPFGDGYVLRQSLAITLMGGMVTSTFLTLFIIPMIYNLVERKKVKA